MCTYILCLNFSQTLHKEPIGWPPQQPRGPSVGRAARRLIIHFAAHTATIRCAARMMLVGLATATGSGEPMRYLRLYYTIRIAS